MNVRHLLWVGLLAIPMIIYLNGEEARLVHTLEARGYSNIKMEHPNQYHCLRRWNPYSYRAIAPTGSSVHGGACVFFFIIETTEPIPG